MDKAIESLIDLHSPDLSRLCRSLCSCEQDAEDLFQITWEKVIRNFRKYNPEKPFDKWLFAVCVNAHRDMLRNPFRKRVVFFDKSEELENLIKSIPDGQEHKDEYLSLHCAINKLDIKRRQVVALYYFKDYSTSELSEIIGIPEGTVKSRLASAREQLRKELRNAQQ